MQNSDIAEVFQQIAEILEIKEENPFKIRAYQNAALAISRLGENLPEKISNGGRIDVPGVGKDLALKIKELVDTGRLAYYDELVKSVPEGLLELLKLRGLGPKRANFLYKNFNIKGIKELTDALKGGKLNGVQGFGDKSIENLKKSIEEYKVFKQRFLYVDALNQAYLFDSYLKNTTQKLIRKIQFAGSLRRKMETVGDIDIVASVIEGKEEEFRQRFLDYPEVLRVDSSGETKISVVLKSGIYVDLRIVGKDDFVYALHHFTGSKLHNEELRSREKKFGYKINEYGIFMTDDDTMGDNNINFIMKAGKLKTKRRDYLKNKDNKIIVDNEAEFYDVFGMQFIPPELREGTGEIEAALGQGIPVLLEEKDLQGIFHVHTTYTDGKESLESMIDACIKEKFKYVGISDHSVSAHYANGLSGSELESQMEYIDRLNKKYEGKIKIFKGIESDILPDGRLDYDEKILSKLDFVIASVHSNFNMAEDIMTERIMNAIKNPYTTMIGHLTGRLLLERNGYALNILKVLDCASKYKTIIEINANPKRLDLDWRYIKEAISRNVILSINPDAHNSLSISFAVYGVNIARKGWAKKSDILNTRSASEVESIFNAIRDYKRTIKT